MTAVFDTNILIDQLNGVSEAADCLGRHDRRIISRVTWIELLVGAKTAAMEADAIALLAQFDVHELSASLAARVVAIRRERRLKLPDAIIYATADALGISLITRNTNDFPESDPLVRVPYRL